MNVPRNGELSDIIDRPRTQNESPNSGAIEQAQFEFLLTITGIAPRYLTSDPHVCLPIDTEIACSRPWWSMT
jgi:hypothetical protein